MMDKNNTPLKVGDFVKDEDGKIAEIQDIRGAIIFRFEKRGFIKSKIDFTKIEKIDGDECHQ